MHDVYHVIKKKSSGVKVCSEEYMYMYIIVGKTEYHKLVLRYQFSYDMRMMFIIKIKYMYTVCNIYMKDT